MSPSFKITFFLFFYTIFFTSAFAFPAVNKLYTNLPTYTVQPQNDISYGSDPMQKLDLCLPDRPATSSPAIAVLLVHGGSWTGGDKLGYRRLCNKIASKGIVVANINYRLIKKNPDGTLRQIWPTQVNDLQLAIRYLKKNASSYKLDSNKICTWGSSAGGQMSAFVGASNSTYPGYVSQILPEHNSVVECSVVQAGPVDLKQRVIDSGFVRGSNSNLVNYPVTGMDGLWEASPVRVISSSSARMLILHGKQDDRVPMTQAGYLINALTNAGVAQSNFFYQGNHGSVSGWNQYYEKIGILFLYGKFRYQTPDLAEIIAAAPKEAP